jgi:tripartite ATP-independent transporter DctM subunit
LFSAAFLPGLLLVGAYVTYILIWAYLNPEKAPALPDEVLAEFRDSDFLFKVFKAFVMPIILITLVLGSIFTGYASPTEAAAVGALGAMVLTIIQKKFNLSILKQVMQETTHLTSMVFLILLGATTFSLVFRGLGGDKFLIESIVNSDMPRIGFLLIVMLVVFIAGFFIDFIEIVFIIVPVVTPIFIQLDFDLIWVGILIALNLQTSFLTPPFGFALFYLKGVAPPEVKTTDLYLGIIPFLVIQLILLIIVILFPQILIY